jgi:membrane-associated phospholipid phosphatase
LLPHEFVFGGFLALLTAALTVVIGPFARDTLLFAALLVTAGALVWWCSTDASRARWCVRLAYYPVAMNAAYFALRTAVPALHPRLYDDALQSADRALLGGNASLWLQRFAHPALTEFMSFCYVIFFPYLLFSWITYLVQPDLRLAQKFWSGFFAIYGLGFLGYLLVPAIGPHLEPGLAAQFTPFRGPITDLNTRIVLSGSNRVDCFPSLHCAISSYILFFDLRHRRWRFWLYLVPCVGLWVSTLYLRYHYFVDVLAGFALSAAALWLAHRSFPTENS